MILEDFPTNLIAFQQQFASDQDCLRYVRRQRWGNEKGFACPKCKHDKCWEGRTRNLLYCSSCGHQASITAGTVYHSTRKSLCKWFMAMYLISSSKQGMSAKELQRQLGLGSYQTAWAWLHKLRACIVDPNRQPLKGEVEVDETYIGGIAPESAKGRSVIKKTAVICSVEKDGRRCGRVRLGIIANATKEKLTAFLDGKLEPETTVHTDGWRGYSDLERSGYAHIRTVAHGKEAHIHLPRVHRIFSLLKRWLLGTHQGAVSRKHLQAYLDEYVFRFNRRNAKNICHIFQRLSEGVVREQCRPYWQLVGRSKGTVSMRQHVSLHNLVFDKKYYTREEIMEMYPNA